MGSLFRPETWAKEGEVGEDLVHQGVRAAFAGDSMPNPRVVLSALYPGQAAIEALVESRRRKES
jgi:hypothetical protein